MSETKVFTFPESGTGSGGSGMLGMLAPLLQKNGLDPNLLLAMNNKGNNGFGGEGGWFIWVIFLFFLMGWGGNGFGNNGFGGRNGSADGIPNLINNDTGRELLMSAIQGNGTAINQLASTLNCSVGQIQSSINQVMNSVQGVGNQVGMTGQQIINAIQQGNMNIAQQLCNCCCEINGNITKMGYENQLAVCQQTHTLVDNANLNALSLRDANLANTNAILSKLDTMQNQALLDKIDKLREEKSTLLNQINNGQQTAAIQAFQAQSIAPVNAALGDLSARLAKIECKQPETVTIPYVPAMGSFIPVNYGVNVNPYAVSAAGCGC